MGPYKWHSLLFDLFFVWLPTWGYIIGVTPNNIDSQAQVEHHSITGDWEGPNFLGEQIIKMLRDQSQNGTKLDQKSI